MKRGLVTAIAVLGLLVASIGISVTALFTSTGFDALGFHTIALHFFQGRIDEAMLAGVRISGLGFEQNQIAHLVDVKALLGIVRLAAGFSIGLGLALALMAPKVFARAALVAPLVFMSIGGLIVAGYFSFGFIAVGVFLHEIVFPQGNYAFDWNSLIIRLYGPEVMIRGTSVVIGLSLALLLLGAVAGRMIGKRHPI